MPVLKQLSDNYNNEVVEVTNRFTNAIREELQKRGVVLDDQREGYHPSNPYGVYIKGQYKDRICNFTFTHNGAMIRAGIEYAYTYMDYQGKLEVSTGRVPCRAKSLHRLFMAMDKTLIKAQTLEKDQREQALRNINARKASQKDTGGLQPA